MAKRGRKLGEGNGGNVPFDVIAKRLGVSVRTVSYDYERAIRKLREAGTLNELRELVHVAGIARAMRGAQ